MKFITADRAMFASFYHQDKRRLRRGGKAGIVVSLPITENPPCALFITSPCCSPPSAARPHRHPTPRPRPNRRSTPPTQIGLGSPRSEERRVGKECRSRGSPYH